MHEDLRARIEDLARRASVRDLPPKTLAAGVAVCAVIVAAAIWHWWPSPSATRLDRRVSTSGSRDASAPTTTGDSVQPISGETTAGMVYVHVVGAVRAPGLYQLPRGARVAEALERAGGLLGSAAERAVNLAREVTDGEQIVVPSQDEFARSGASGAAPVGSPQPASGQDPTTGALVDINSADANALDALPGVGPSTAAKIVADREANGPFSSPDDLGRVSGIGPKKLETLLPLIVAR